MSFQITSHPFWFKRELSVLNMILETPASFDSVFRDIAEFPIDSVTDFDDTCDNSLWPMFVVRLNDLVHLLSTVSYNRPYNEPLRRENFVHTLPVFAVKSRFSVTTFILPVSLTIIDVSNKGSS